jgi:hypothetical protein
VDGFAACVAFNDWWQNEVWVIDWLSWMMQRFDTINDLKHIMEVCCGECDDMKRGCEDVVWLLSYQTILVQHSVYRIWA